MSQLSDTPTTVPVPCGRPLVALCISYRAYLVPVNSVGVMMPPPGHGGQIAPNQIQQSPGNVPIRPVFNQYPVPMFAYSPYGPPIPIMPENMHNPPPYGPGYGHYIEDPRSDLTLNPNAQDFFPDMINDRPATAEPYATEHEVNSSAKLSSSEDPVNSVGLINTPPGDGGQIAPNQMHQSQGNVPIFNQYPAPLFAYSPYGPPIPIIPENMHIPPPYGPGYGHYIEVPRPDLPLNPNAQDFFPDMLNERQRPATAEPYATEHEVNSSAKLSSSESTLQISHCQVTRTFVHHSHSTAYDSEPGIVVVRARESHSDPANDSNASRTHSKSWSEETAEMAEHELVDSYYSNVSPITYEGQPILIENSYGSDKSYNPLCPECHPPPRNDHYNRGNVNYYGNYNKPRFSGHSGTPNTRYAPANDFPHGNDSPRQNQPGNYSPSERGGGGGGHYYNNRGRGGRGRSYKQNKPHYNQNTQTDGSGYYRRGNRYNNNNNNNNNYNKKPAE